MPLIYITVLLLQRFGKVTSWKSRARRIGILLLRSTSLHQGYCIQPDQLNSQLQAGEELLHGSENTELGVKFLRVESIQQTQF